MGGQPRHLAALGLLTAAVVLVMAGFAALDGRPSHLAVEAEAAALAAAPFTPAAEKDVVVITGSSTVRFWHSSSRAFPESQVVNTGFGGSTMEQLRRHYDGLIARFQPDGIYIGSGDNDLAAGRSVAEVHADAAHLIDAIERDLPDATVALIAAKPSLQRWHLRDRYQQLNTAFGDLAAEHERVVFVDVWTELLNADGRVRPELYASDGLHLNPRGYRIYAAAVADAGADLGQSIDADSLT